MAENEDALLAAGYSKNKEKPFHYNGKGDFSRGRVDNLIKDIGVDRHIWQDEAYLQ